jgi:hypothetical protein
VLENNVNILEYSVVAFFLHTLYIHPNSIPKGVTTHVQNKTSDFNGGDFLGGHPVQNYADYVLVKMLEI